MPVPPYQCYLRQRCSRCCRFVNMQTTELFKTFQDVIVPERPAVLCSMHSRRLLWIQIRSAIHLQNRQAAESPHSVHLFFGLGLFSAVCFAVSAGLLVLVQSFVCLLTCKDRAISATSATLEEKNTFRLPTDEPCRQSCAARGRPRLSYREYHWIAPVMEI